MQTTTIAGRKAHRADERTGRGGHGLPRGWSFLAALAVSLGLWAVLLKLVGAAF